jgi:hypothetical protein
MRDNPRPRRTVPPSLLTLLVPAFRHSSTRDAYVLRGVGQHVGPVLTPRRPQRPARTR